MQHHRSTLRIQLLGLCCISLPTCHSRMNGVPITFQFHFMYIRDGISRQLDADAVQLSLGRQQIRHAEFQQLSRLEDGRQCRL